MRAAIKIVPLKSRFQLGDPVHRALSGHASMRHCFCMPMGIVSNYKGVADVTDASHCSRPDVGLNNIDLWYNE